MRPTDWVNGWKRSPAGTEAHGLADTLHRLTALRSPHLTRTVDLSPWTVEYDALAFAGPGELVYASTVLGPGFAGLTDTVGGASRVPNASDTDSISDWMRNDFNGEGLPGFAGSTG